MATHREMTWVAGLAGAAILALATAATAQQFPSKPVTVIIGTATGSTMTNSARALTEQLEVVWKQPIILENRPGGGGLIGAEAVRRAAPDGHTLVFATTSYATFPLFTKGVTFDFSKDLSPISVVSWSPYTMYTSGKLPVRNLREFIAYAQANPGKLNFGSIGRNAQLLTLLRFTKSQKLNMEAIQYSATAAALPALIANDIQLFLTSAAEGVQHVKAGTMVPLGIMSDTRSRELPDVPTLKEMGIDQVAGFWFGFMAPPGTPAAIREKISADVRAALKLPATQAAFQRLGLETVGSTPGEMARTVADDLRVHREAAEAGGIKPE